jgi:hypothetical protein
MLCKSRSLGHRLRLTSASALPLYLLLAACGGGGDGAFVASTPPPPPTPTPTPTPTPNPDLLKTIQGYSISGSLDVQTSWLDSPATRSGTYDVLGRLTINPGTGHPTDWTNRTIAPGEFTFSVAGPHTFFNYELNAVPGILPGGLTSLGPTSIVDSWEINQHVAYLYDHPYASFPQALGQRLIAFDKAGDGSEKQAFSYDLTRGSTGTLTSLSANTNLRTALDYDIGYSYVAMGEWSWSVVDLNGNSTPSSNFGELLFVNGDRTPASGIPASGTATYDARSLSLLSSTGTPGIPFTLTADFGLRTIATRIDQNYQNYGTGDGEPIQGIHVGGSSPFSNDGSFDIPLSGTVNYSYQNLPAPPPSQAATGDMNGAFFGPHAEQVGGTFFLQRTTDQLPLYQDAFVGQQHPH